MQSKAESPKAYIEELPENRKAPFKKLRATIRKHLPKGFSEQMSYGMIGYVVPHSLYPNGYHCDPKLPLPFMNIANQKNYIAVYHSGIYSDPKLMKWFTAEFPKYSGRKLDMGKSCIRFKYVDDIPYDLLGELASKMTVDDWIKTYERALNR